jgi:isochorismate pyruvate lyase
MRSGYVKSAFWLFLAISCFAVVALHALPAAREAIAVFSQTFSYVWHDLLDDQLFNVVLAAALGVYAILRIRHILHDAKKAPAESPMAAVRARVDVLDDQLVELLARRQQLIGTAATIKRANDIPARVPERVEEVLRRVALRAEAVNLDVALSQGLWRDIIEWSIAYEERLMIELPISDPGAGATGETP